MTRFTHKDYVALEHGDLPKLTREEIDDVRNNGDDIYMLAVTNALPSEPNFEGETGGLRSPSLRGATPEEFAELFTKPFMDDVDHLLADKTQEEAHFLLRGMVVDLMEEVDALKLQLRNREVRINDLKDERMLMSEDYRDNLFSLIAAVRNATRESNKDGSDDPNSADDGSPDSPTKKLLRENKQLPSMEATEMVIKKFTKKIEDLNIENSRLMAFIQAQQDRIEDLECYKETSTLKIRALEGQVKKTRQRSGPLKLVDRTNARTVKPGKPWTLTKTAA